MTMSFNSVLNILKMIRFYKSGQYSHKYQVIKTLLSGKYFGKVHISVHLFIFNKQLILQGNENVKDTQVT